MTDQDPDAPDATSPSQGDVLAQAAAERRHAPVTQSEAADLADKYDRMIRLAALFDDSGEQLRRWSRLGRDVLADPDVHESAPLSPSTWAEVEDDLSAATGGKRGLLSRSIELDADALVLRATVLTYRWIDELQVAATQTLGTIAGRAIGYLAPEVALGGAIVSAGLIETDAIDRDGVAAYLNELAESNPDLMEHVTSGGGGLLDGLQMRSILTAGLLAGDRARPAGLGGLRAIGVPGLGTSFSAALRDVAGGLEGAVSGAPGDDPPPPSPDVESAPRCLADLMTTLGQVRSSVAVTRVGRSRYIAYLPGPGSASASATPRLRLVGGDSTSYAAEVVRRVEEAVGDDPEARVMLVGSALGGVTATEIAAGVGSGRFVIDQVVTAGSPSAHVPRVPASIRVLSLEDRSDPVALLGSLINAGAANRVTVVFDGDRSSRAAAAAEPDTDGTAESIFVAGGRAADRATHPDLVAEIARIAELGFLAG